MWGHAYRPPEDVKRTGHKQGRHVTTTHGYLQYDDGSQIDLHKMLTQDKSSVSLMPIHTNIMRNSGLHHGGFVLVDRALKPKRGSIIAVRYNDMIVIRRLEKSLTHWQLVADDPREEKLLIGEFAEVELLGVIIWAVKPCSHL